MNSVWLQLLEFNHQYVAPSASVLIPLAVLGLGWLAALMLSGMTRRLLRRRYGKALLSLVVGSEASGTVDAERWIGRGVFYTALLFVLAGFFQIVGMTSLTEPFVRALNEVFAFGPRVISAGLLLLIAWITANVVRRLLRKALLLSRVDERLAEHTGIEPAGRFDLPETVSNAAYWLVFLVFLPALLGALGLDGLLQPVRQMLGKMLAFLPNILGAMLILFVGLLSARAVQRIVSSLLAASRVDELGARIGLSGERASLSALSGSLLHAFILVLVAIAALESLNFEAISAPASRVLGLVMSAIPSVLVAGALLALAYAVGRFIAGILRDVLDQVGLDGFLVRLGIGFAPEHAPRVSQSLGYLATIGIILFAAVEAAAILGFTDLAQLLTRLLLFASNLVFGLLIFSLGLFLANLLGGLVRNSVQRHGKLLATIVKVSILVLTTFMALREMGIAEDIINLAFGLVLGALAVAASIAFGLGGRDLAARRMEQWLDAATSDGDNT